MAGDKILPHRAGKSPQAEIVAGVEVEGDDLLAELIGDAGGRGDLEEGSRFFRGR
jgi:hypothetical protein